jgi:glycosyltransferase involved in cell wall biosynthesis
MKRISILVPTFNESENVVALYEAISALFVPWTDRYDLELVFIDNKSKDDTRQKIHMLCHKDPHVKAIFNAKDFGQFNSPYYGICQTTGECTMVLAADFQDPVEMIPRFLAEWEKGTRIVIGIKTTSKENGLVYFLRTQYYRFIHRFSEVEQIEHFTGFGLYDRSFVDILRSLKDPMPYMRGIVAELGFERVEIPYEQPRRRAGKSSNNWYKLFDGAMLGITSYTKVGLRVATIFGMLISVASFLVGIVYLILKLVYWNRFAAGTAPILIGMFFLGALQIFFIGFLGEYIMAINTRVLNRPLVVEEQRLNFQSESERGSKDIQEGASI